jgi:hypothetical protein
MTAADRSGNMAINAIFAHRGKAVLQLRLQIISLNNI